MNYGARHSCNDTDSVKTYNDRCIKEAIENVPVKLLTQFTSIDVEEFAKELADWFLKMVSVTQTKIIMFRYAFQYMR